MDNYNNTLEKGPRQLLHVFDVDGTLTHHDTLLLLIRFVKPGWGQQLKLWLSVLPAAIVAVLTRSPQKLKVALLSRLWKAETKAAIATACSLFFKQKTQSDLRPRAVDYLKQLLKSDPEAKLVLLSASCDAWLQPLADYLGAELICTRLEYNKQNQFTGKFASPNCKGAEKVHRLQKKYPPDAYEFICYADSPSDKPLQTISKQFFYRYF